MIHQEKAFYKNSQKYEIKNNMKGNFQFWKTMYHFVCMCI